MPFQSFENDIFLKTIGTVTENPTIVFLHGAGMDHSIWEKQIAYFENAGFHIVLLDLPAHGKSKGEAAPSIAQMAEDIVRIIKDAGLNDVILTGHSMGALIALAAAASGNKNISAACLCGISSRMPVHPDLLDLAKNNDIKAAKMIAKWSYGSALSEEELDTHISSTITLVDNASDGILANDMNACNNFAEAQAISERINIPILLLLGEEDKMTPVKGAEKLAAMLEDTHKVIIPKAGHMMMQEDSLTFNTALKEFAET